MRVRHPRAPHLLPAENREPPRLPPHNYPEKLCEFLHRVWKENSWVSRIYTLPYSGQAAIKGVGFEVRQTGEGRVLVGTYRDHTGFGARFAVRLSVETPENLTWAAEYLNRTYAE